MKDTEEVNDILTKVLESNPHSYDVLLTSYHIIQSTRALSSSQYRGEPCTARLAKTAIAAVLTASKHSFPEPVHPKREAIQKPD